MVSLVPKCEGPGAPGPERWLVEGCGFPPIRKEREWMGTQEWRLLDDEVDQLARDYDDFDDRLAGDAGLDLFVGEGGGFDGFGVGIDGDADHGDQLAVDLDGDFELVFPGQLRVALRPRGAQDGAGFAQLFPQLGDQMRRKGSEQQDEIAQKRADDGRWDFAGG